MLCCAVLCCLHQVLSDFTVVSGDSLGHVQVWDGGIGTLRQSFAMHEADVLSVQVSSDQKHFYATGIDSKIVQFSSVEEEEDGEGVGMVPKRWVSTKSRRYHTHDIVSMVVVSDSKGDELVIAGGVDTQLRYDNHFTVFSLRATGLLVLLFWWLIILTSPTVDE